MGGCGLYGRSGAVRATRASMTVVFDEIAYAAIGTAILILGLRSFRASRQVGDVTLG